MKGYVVFVGASILGSILGLMIGARVDFWLETRRQARESWEREPSE